MSFGAMTGPVDMTFPNGATNPLSISGDKLIVNGPIRLHRKNDPSTELFLIDAIEILINEDDFGRRSATALYKMKKAADNPKGGAIQFDMKLKSSAGTTIDTFKAEVVGAMEEGQTISSSSSILTGNPIKYCKAIQCIFNGFT
jgi:hypothetical protein